MNDAKSSIREIYSQVAALYDRVAPDLGQAALGYEILYGPPIIEPPVLFVGYQPGGHMPEKLPLIWPDECEYGKANTSYRLARRLQVAFDPKFLLKCTGTNAIFLRAPRQDKYREISPSIRIEFEETSLRSVKEIMGLLRPQLVVTLGFDTMKLFTVEEGQALREGGRRLLYVASIEGIPAMAMHHPTPPANPPSNEDLKKIGQFVMHHLGSSA